MATWGALEVERVEPGKAGTIIYRVSGAITFGNDGSSFLQRIKDDVDAGCSHLVLNLKNVDHIDSGGIGVLCAGFTTVRNARGSLSIVGLSARHQTLLKTVGLTAFFQVVASEDDLGL